MTPQEQEQAPSFELPQVRPPEEGRAAPLERPDNYNESQSSKALEHGVPPTTAAGALPQQTQQQAGAPQQAADEPMAAAQAVATAPGWAPQIADDTDLIEKEWVTKAKEIVARTAHDPHLQNKEMTKFKADYLKKRYNKDIKLGDDT